MNILEPFIWLHGLIYGFSSWFGWLVTWFFTIFIWFIVIAVGVSLFLGLVSTISEQVEEGRINARRKLEEDESDTK